MMSRETIKKQGNIIIVYWTRKMSTLRYILCREVFLPTIARASVESIPSSSL